MLLQDSIKAEEVQQSSLILQYYCFMFAPLYGSLTTYKLLIIFKCITLLGEEHMTANNSLTFALAEVCRNIGAFMDNFMFPI